MTTCALRRRLEELEELDIRSVGALLYTADGRYLMQLRDDLPHVRFGGHWGVFGGRIEGRESPIRAFEREMYEELRFRPRKSSLFTRVTFPHHDERVGMHRRYFFACAIDDQQISGLTLLEGQAMRLFRTSELEVLRNIVPCDRIAIDRHSARGLVLET